MMAEGKGNCTDKIAPVSGFFAGWRILDVVTERKLYPGTIFFTRFGDGATMGL